MTGQGIKSSSVSNPEIEDESKAMPVGREERIFAIDALRGFALLGILVMNIASFGLPEAAYFFPVAAGGSTGWNYASWFIAYSLCEGKMRAMFSMMFGASVYLLMERLSRKGMASEAADIHYRRMLWLLLFGLLHAFLIWSGDILYFYAICGLFLYPLRKLSPKALIISACVLFLFISASGIGRYFHARHLRAEYASVKAEERAGKKLTKEQEETRESWTEANNKSFPPADELQKIYDAHRGGYLKLLVFRAKSVLRLHGLPLYTPSLYFDMLEMMLIGIALIKLGVLTGDRSRKLYWWMAGLGFAIGITSHAITAWIVARQGFSLVSQSLAEITYESGRLAVFGYCAALLLLLKSGVLRRSILRLAAVGQMAFSNYILTSLICVTLFEGFGCGLFGKLQRWQLYPIVLGIWIVQLVISPIWLRHFRFGPLEWAWRSLTYCKAQPMRVREMASSESSNL
jgi:uncharacterized protein